jgi:hypothetical protein
MSPFMSETLTGRLDVDELLSQLTVDEKVALLAGEYQFQTTLS